MYSYLLNDFIYFYIVYLKDGFGLKDVNQYNNLYKTVHSIQL